MIIYLDTSALVKVFVAEAHSEPVRQAISTARLTITHVIAYVEACAAFARAARSRRNNTVFTELRKNLDAQWSRWEILEASEALIRRAADLSGEYHLRGYDSLHLAAAESAFKAFPGHMPFRFAVFDDRLSAAAIRAGIPLLEA